MALKQLRARLCIYILLACTTGVGEQRAKARRVRSASWDWMIVTSVQSHEFLNTNLMNRLTFFSCLKHRVPCMLMIPWNCKKKWSPKELLFDFQSFKLIFVNEIFQYLPRPSVITWVEREPSHNCTRAYKCLSRCRLWAKLYQLYYGCCLYRVWRRSEALHATRQ